MILSDELYGVVALTEKGDICMIRISSWYNKWKAKMTKMVNNVDLEKISQTIESGKMDKFALRKPVKLQGEWILDSSKGYQFRTELAYEKGKQVIEIDSPSFLGGNGNRLGPMAY